MDTGSEHDVFETWHQVATAFVQVSRDYLRLTRSWIEQGGRNLDNDRSPRAEAVRTAGQAVCDARTAMEHAHVDAALALAQGSPPASIRPLLGQIMHQTDQAEAAATELATLLQSHGVRGVR